MGAIIDELDDHEGYALRRLADGTLSGAWTHGVEFSAYVAGCAYRLVTALQRDRERQTSEQEAAGER